MFKFNNSIVPNKVRIEWHFSSNKYAYRDAYSALKSMENSLYFLFNHINAQHITERSFYIGIITGQVNSLGAAWHHFYIY